MGLRYVWCDRAGPGVQIEPPGEEIPSSQSYGANVKMLAALGSRGVDGVMPIDGTTDAEVFHVYVEEVLRPTLRPGALVIMDHLRAQGGWYP